MTTPEQTQIIESIISEMEHNSANQFVMLTGRVYIRQAMEQALERYDALKSQQVAKEERTTTPLVNADISSFSAKELLEHYEHCSNSLCPVCEEFEERMADNIRAQEGKA